MNASTFWTQIGVGVNKFFLSHGESKGLFEFYFTHLDSLYPVIFSTTAHFFPQERHIFLFSMQSPTNDISLD